MSLHYKKNEMTGLYCLISCGFHCLQRHDAWKLRFNLHSLRLRSLIFSVKLCNWKCFVLQRALRLFFFFFPSSSPLLHLNLQSPLLSDFPPEGKRTSAAAKHFQPGDNVLISIKAQGGKWQLRNGEGIQTLSSIPLLPTLLKRSSQVYLVSVSLS